jgi:hypothetical protein
MTRDRWATGELGLIRTANNETPGTRSRNKPSRFGSKAVVNVAIPVTLPPGRLKLSIKPKLTGSPPITIHCRRGARRVEPSGHPVAEGSPTFRPNCVETRGLTEALRKTNPQT